MAAATSTQEHRRPASIMADKGPNLTDANGKVQSAEPKQTTPPPALSSEQSKTIELQAARIKQLEDTVKKANEVIEFRAKVIKEQEARVINLVGVNNRLTVQSQQQRRN